MYMSYISHKKNKVIKNKTIKTKGGVRFIESFTQDTAIQYFIKNSTFSVFSRSNIYGIMVLGKLNSGADSPYRMVRTNNIHTRVSQILFKFFILGTKTEYYDDFTTTTTEDIQRETIIQQDIYNKSFNDEKTLLEPICPCIVYSHPYALKSKIKDMFISKISNINESQYIETLFKKDIAFIAMEFMNDYKTLNSLKKSPKYEIYKYMAIYELNNLHKLGYMHNDFHFDNVLIHETYNYFDFAGSGRAIIIDFGLSDLLADNTNQIELLEKELGQINKDVLQIFASLDEKHIAVQTEYISAIENQSKKKIHDLIKLFVLYKGGMKIKRIGITPKKHEWSLIPIEELKDLMVNQFLENLKIQNPKSYNEFTNGIESVLEIEKKYPDYLESLFKGQSTGLIQIDNKK